MISGEIFSGRAILLSPYFEEINKGASTFEALYHAHNVAKNIHIA
jgi:hypothetical protein